MTSAPDPPEQWLPTVEVVVGGEPVQVWERSVPDGTAAGPHLVFVHGFEESWDCWGPLAAHLPSDCRVSSLELPWHNNSDHVWARAGDAASWLEHGLRALRVAPDLVVAHSFGACALVQLLACLNGSFRTPAALVAPVLRRQDPFLDPKFFEGAVGRFRGVIREGLTVRLGPRSARLLPGVLDRMVDTVLERVGAEGVLHFYLELARLARLRPEHISVPLLILGGDDDPSAPENEVADLRARLPDVRVRRQPDLGHFCHVEEAARIAEHLLRFLAELQLTTPREELTGP
ncbi:alpha/beta fold hydrolase [Streptomyces sulphureus]|uniref:alpha/beta fold hydrolase n=1 Tax=Streptomyces sulphureus TaxID=47758 RepID=UPI0003676089|nr:alpha/beta hydrolase [Streptomyces sulphureus]